MPIEHATSPEEAKVFMAKISAARLGCGRCSGPVRVPPAGEPFSKGPYKGRYWCQDCWTLYWDENPKHLTDEESRKYVAEEAQRIRLKRGAELLHQDAESKVYLTPKGTIVFDLRSSVELAQNEFDPEKFGILLRAIKAIDGKFPPYEGAPSPA